MAKTVINFYSNLCKMFLFVIRGQILREKEDSGVLAVFSGIWVSFAGKGIQD